jgi:hypothetical protein
MLADHPKRRSYVDAEAFVGRKWLIPTIKELFKRPECRILLITGSPGVGKSALLAHLSDDDPGCFNFVLRRDSIMGLESPDAKSFLLAFGYYLAQIRPALFIENTSQINIEQRVGQIHRGGEVVGAKIDRLVASPFSQRVLNVLQDIKSASGSAVGLKVQEWVQESRQLSLDDLLDLALFRPLKKLEASDTNTEIHVYIDALDEIELSGRRGSEHLDANATLLDLLRDVRGLPSNLKIIATSRLGHFLEPLRSLDYVTFVPIDENRSENRQDLREFVVGALSSLANCEYIPPDYAERLIDRASGNFLYAALVLRSLSASMISTNSGVIADDFDEMQLPQGLSALYRLIISRMESFCQRDHPLAWGDLISPFLGLLALARRALSHDEIAVATGLSRSQVASLVRSLGQILQTDQGAIECVALFHPSLREYLLDIEGTYKISRHDVVLRMYEMTLFAWGGMADGLPGLRVENSHYVLDHLAQHLVEIGQPADAARFLSVPRVMASGVRFSGPRRMIADISLICDAPQRVEEAEILGTLSEYLKKYGGWLAENPDAFIPQLIEWHARLSTSQDQQFSDYIRGKVVPLCREVFPRGCLWTNEAIRRPTKRTLGAGVLGEHLVQYGVELPGGLIAVSGVDSHVFVFDHDSLLRTIKVPKDLFVCAIFAFQRGIGVAGTCGEFARRRGVILWIDPHDGSQREVFRFDLPEDEAVIRAAAAVSETEVQVIMGGQPGLIFCFFLCCDKQLTAHVQEIPGSVTAAACLPDGTALIALVDDLENEQGRRDHLALATASRGICRWNPKEDKVNELFSSKKSIGRILWLRLSPFHRSGVRNLGGELFSNIDSIVRGADGSVYLARSDSILRTDSSGKKPKLIYKHNQHIKALATIGPDLLVFGSNGEVVFVSTKAALTSDSAKEISGIVSLPDGQVIVLESGKPKTIWNPETSRGQKIAMGKGLRAHVMRAAAVDRSGTLIVFATFGGGAVFQASAFGERGTNVKVDSYAVTACPDSGFLCVNFQPSRDVMFAGLSEGIERYYQILKVEQDGGYKKVFVIPEEALRGERPTDLFLNDSNDVVIVTERGRALLWDLSRGHLRGEIQLQKFNCPSVSGPMVGLLSNGRIVGCDLNGAVRVWDSHGQICATLLLDVKPICLVSSPQTDQITAVDNGSIVSLSIRNDPASLPAKPRPAQRTSRREWHFPYFPSGELLPALRRSLRSVIVSFALCLIGIKILFRETWTETLHLSALAVVCGAIASHIELFWKHVKLNRALSKSRRGI